MACRGSACHWLEPTVPVLGFRHGDGGVLGDNRIGAQVWQDLFEDCFGDGAIGKHHAHHIGVLYRGD